MTRSLRAMTRSLRAMTRSLWWPIILIASAIGVGLAMYLNIETPIRPVIGFWFLFFCPGMAYVRILRIREIAVELIAAIALSMAVNIILSSALVLASIWSSSVALGILIALTMVGATIQIIGSRNKPKETHRRILGGGKLGGVNPE